MTAVITLSDPDNRGDDGHFMMTATMPDCIPYLDRVVRRDTMSWSHHFIDAAVSAMRAGNFSEAKEQARQVGVYLSAEGQHVEAVTVQDLGEDSDMWVVTGTTDAHSAEEAVRAHYKWLSGESLEHCFGVDHVDLDVKRQDLMRWSNLNEDGKPDERSRLIRHYRWALASRDQYREWMPLSAPFNGFMVQA